MDNKDKFWNDFCQEHKIIEQGVPLFETVGSIIRVFPYGQNKRLLLKRSDLMNSFVISEVSKVIEDFQTGSNRYEGLIYMMFWKDGSRVIPLYIGKSEKYGLDGQKLSANIADIENNTGKFCRWGYNYSYHIGNLSAVVCPGHPKDKIKSNYKQWAKTLFKSFPSEKPQLKQQTYFWIKAWEKGTHGPWKDYGATSLTMLEFLFIGMANDCFPELFLNREGLIRR